MTVRGGVSEETEGTYTSFFEQRGGDLVRLAYLLVGDLADAEDVAQEVMEELYRKWPVVRQDTAMAYARTAVVNRSRSLLRRRAVARRFAPRLAQPEQGLPARSEGGWLWDVVKALPRRQREVVVLRYWCDMSETDIARVLGVSSGTVKSCAHRALEQLAAAVDAADVTGDIIRSRKEVQ